MIAPWREGEPMVNDSTQCYTDLPRGPRKGQPCLTRRGLIDGRTWTSPTWWRKDPAQAQAIAAAEGAIVRELLCPGCQRRSDQRVGRDIS